MRFARPVLLSILLAGLVTMQAVSASLVVFPKAARLISPDRRLVVESKDRNGSSAQYVGTFHSLWLTEVATGRSRKLIDYIGLAAVAWSDNEYVVITEYVGRKTSRAMVFPVVEPREPVVLDVSSLIQMIAVEARDTLRGNDHVFIEAVRLQQETFVFRVWGYGQHDPDGFHWNCEYLMSQDKVSCLPGKTTFDR